MESGVQEFVYVSMQGAEKSDSADPAAISPTWAPS